jgi:hypothetical protein
MTGLKYTEWRVRRVISPHQVYSMNLLSNLHTYSIRYKDKSLTNERQNTRHKSQISRYTQTEKHKRDTKSPMRGAPRIN